ncbi:unnamed protein product, partial [Effrenium voratum]
RYSCGSTSSASSDHSGPLGGNFRSSAVTPSTSTTSLIVPYAGHRPVPAGAPSNPAYAGEDMRMSYSMDPVGSARSCADGHPRSSCPLSTASEDFQAMSQGPLPPVDAEEEPDTLGGREVELLCQKAQCLVRQIGAQAGFEIAGARGSARSSPCRKVSPPAASPCTPTGRSSDAWQARFSPAQGLTDCSAAHLGPFEDFSELKGRLSQVEQALQHMCQGAPGCKNEVLNLRGRMQTVESEVADVRAELREVRSAVSRLTSSEKLSCEASAPVAPVASIRACSQGGSAPSPSMPARLPAERGGDQAMAPANAIHFDVSPRKPGLPPRPGNLGTQAASKVQVSAFPALAAFQQKAPGWPCPPSPGFVTHMTQPQVNAPQTVRAHPSLRPMQGGLTASPLSMRMNWMTA